MSRPAVAKKKSNKHRNEHFYEILEKKHRGVKQIQKKSMQLTCAAC